MKRIFLAIVMFHFLPSFQAQYELKKEVNGLQVFTKWSHEKWWSKKSDKVLLVKVANTNEVAVSYDLGIEFYKDLQMVEESKAENYCLGAHKSILPRWKGIVFKPSPEVRDVFDSFELTGLDVEKLSGISCTQEP